MRIKFLSYDHPRNPWLGGGGARQLNKLCSKLRARHHIEVISGGWRQGPRRSEVRGVRYKHGPRLPGRHLSRLGYCCNAMSEASDGDYDILVEEVSAFSPTFAPCLTRKPAIADFRLNPFKAAEKYPSARAALRARLRHNLKYFDGAIALSRSLASELATQNARIPEIDVVEPGIDRELFQQVPGEHNYILYLGRLDVEHKGLDTLLEAYSRVRSRFPEIKLFIAGSGPDKGQVRQLIRSANLQQSVEMKGQVEGRRKSDLLRKSLMVAMPSRREGWGQVAAEAAACAKPVVGFDVTGLRDAVITGETGLLVEPEDVEGLTGAMIKLLEDSNLRHRLGEGARRRARSFTWKQTARAYESACLKVVKH